MNNDEYLISRRVYNKTSFDAAYNENRPTPVSLKTRLLQKLVSLKFWSIVSGIFPFYQILASFYTLHAFASDVISGLTMSILHIPQGMAYGYLAGLQPINGLYTSFFPPLAYFFFGTSRHISIGTFSIVALLSSEPVDRLSDAFQAVNNSENSTSVALDDFRLEVAVTVTILSGLIQLVMGLFHLGSLVVYISSPLLGGFTCASAIHVICSQLNGLFGTKLKNPNGPGRLPITVYEFFKSIRTVNVATTIISIICIFILSLFKFLINPRVEAKIRFPIPIELFVLILGTVISHFAKLNQRFNVKIVGKLPQGLPTPMLPNFSIASQVLLQSAIVSFVAIATTVSLVKLYATRGGYDVRYTQEMSALGISNIFGGFFRCHAASGALARTSLAYSAGMQSQVASLISCLVLLLVLTVIGPLFESVPLSVLSSMIVVSLTGILTQVGEVAQLYRICLLDMLTWLVTFLATVFIDVPYGLLVGFVFSLFTIIYRTQMSSRSEMQRICATDVYVNKKSYECTERLSRIKILRFGGPLYYANSETFQQWVYRTSGVDPDKEYKQGTTRASGNRSCVNRATCSHHSSCCKCCFSSTTESESESIPLPEQSTSSMNRIRFIILDISPWGFIDVVGAKTFCELIRSYRRVNIEVLFTCCHSEIRRTLIHSGLGENEFDANAFVTLHDAVLYAEHRLTSELDATADQGDRNNVTRI